METESPKGLDSFLKKVDEYLNTPIQPSNSELLSENISKLTLEKPSDIPIKSLKYLEDMENFSEKTKDSSFAVTNQMSEENSPVIERKMEDENRYFDCYFFYSKIFMLKC